MEFLAPLAIILLGIASTIIVIMLVEPRDFSFLFSLFIVAFGIRVFIGLVMFLLSYQYGVTEGFLFKGDAYCYGLKALYIAKCYKWNTPVDPNYAGSYVAGGSCTNYDYWCGLVYHYLGENPLVLVLINCVAGSLTAIFVYFMAKRIWGKKIAVFSSLLAAFWPSLIMWSSQNLKDPLICLFLVLFFYLYIELKKDYKIYLLPIIGLCLFVLLKLSIYVAIAAFMATCIAIVLSIKMLRKNIILTVIFVLAIAYFGINFPGDKIGEFLLSLQGFDKDLGIFSLDTDLFKIIDFQRRARAEGNLAILPDSDISSFAQAFLYLPVGLLFVLFAPFPWQIGSSAQLMAVPEMLLFYLLLPKLLRGIRVLSRKNWDTISAMVIFMMIMSLIFALVEGNSGTLFRHRSYILYFAFIFISSGFFWKQVSEGSR